MTNKENVSDKLKFTGKFVTTASWLCPYMQLAMSLPAEILRAILVSTAASMWRPVPV